MINALRDHFKTLTSTGLDIKEWKEHDIASMPDKYFFAEILKVSNIEDLESYKELTIPIKLYINKSAKSDKIEDHDALISEMEQVRKHVTVNIFDNQGVIKELRCLSWTKEDEAQGNQYKFLFNLECIYKSID